MIYIAHRGLFEGYNEEMENHPDQIRAALAAGFDAEIDVRLIDGKWFLGHDEPVHEVDDDFMLQDGLWIHCKNHDAIIGLLTIRQHVLTLRDPHYFWHQTDDFALTSHGYVWVYPGKNVDPRYGIRNQPEWDKYWSESISDIVGHGVCSKFVRLIKDVHRAK
jgi:hypothetical protein